MANLVGVVGASGHGKSSSFFPNEELKIKGLNPKETVFINVSGKSLPIKGFHKLYPSTDIRTGGNYIHTEDSDVISKVVEYVATSRPEIKNIVIDDAGYTMGLEVLAKAKNKGFDKWTDLALNHMKIINAARGVKRNDLNIIFTYHQEKGADGNLKIKTSGSMIDNNILLDGLFTTILYACVTTEGQVVKYGFKTHGDGSNTCKSPASMFKEDIIPNDMGYVLDKMNEYYN